MNKELFIECDYYSEGIKFNHDEDGLLYISLYQRGFKPRTKTLKEKLRSIWQIIIKDVPYDDEVIISKDKIQKLTQFMNQIYPNNASFMSSKISNKELKIGTLYIIEGETLPFRYIKYSNQPNDIYYFKHHNLKKLRFEDTNLIIREANQKEINLYNSLKEKMNDIANRIY